MSLPDRPGGLHISYTRCPCGRKTKNNSTDSSPLETRVQPRATLTGLLTKLSLWTDGQDEKNADVNTACSRAVEIRDRWLTERAHECLGTQYDDVSLLTLSSCKSCPSNRPLVLYWCSVQTLKKNFVVSMFSVQMFKQPSICDGFSFQKVTHVLF